MNNLLTTTKWGSLVDLIVVAFIIFFALIGLRLGFIQRFIGILSKFLSILIAFSLCKPFAKWINSIFGLDKSIANGVSKYFKSETMNTKITSKQELIDALGGESLPKFIKTAVKKIWNVGNDTTLAKLLGNVVGKYCSIAFSFVLLIFITKIVIFIIGKLLTKIEENNIPVIFANKVLGAVLGFVQATIYAYLFLFVLNVLPNGFLSGLQKAVANSKVCKFITNYNIFNFIFSSMLNLK